MLVTEGYSICKPDAGGAVRARKFADMFHADIAIVDKMRRPSSRLKRSNELDRRC